MNEATNIRTITLADRWAMVRRRRWEAIWTGAGVLVVAVLVAFLWPATYRSTGTILIEQQELPADLVQSTITSYADQRIQVISQKVMTTDNLLRIVQRYDLYPKIRKNQAREVLLEKMRQDIHLEMISADVMDPKQGRATKANIAFTVSYSSTSPDIAARVANELVSLYLEENLKSRRQLSADAEKFLDDEANKLEVSISKMEQQIAGFKDRHLNTLPDDGNINRETLIRSEDELREIDTQLRALTQESTYLGAQLAEMSPSSQVYTSTGERVLSPADRLKYLRTEYARVSGIYSPDHPDVLRIKREIAGLEAEAGTVDSSNDQQRELEDAKTQLAQLQQRYSADYPDVVRLQKQVDALTLAISTSPPPAAATAIAHPDNPAYIQIKAQSEVNAAQHKSLGEKRAAVEAQIAELNSRLNAAPGVQRDYDTLLRELDAEQIKYREVREKQMGAKLAENLEDEQKGEHFTLIDPPLTPQKPASPNRLLLLLIGFVLAPAAGLGFAVVSEGNDPNVRSRRDLEELLRVPPLAILPHIATAEELAQQRRRRQLALVGVSGSIALGLILTHLLYRPLDVLWAVAMRKMGG
jgi:uncharacterized protein involved in exopolysaccharide biosynthesis